ncbi:MAG: hypothetical protein WCK47_12705, partial [bacterium]
MLLISGLLLSAAMAGASPPSVNPVLLNKNRVINDVLFEFVPKKYYTYGSEQIGAWLYKLQLARTQDSTTTIYEEARIGESFSSRRLLGAWTPSYGEFRFTLEPSANPPFNRPAAMLLRPTSGTNTLSVYGTSLSDLNQNYDRTELTVKANGTTQGTVLMYPHVGVYPYNYSLNLNDRFSFALSGKGEIEIKALYIYDANLTVPLIKSLENLDLEIHAGEQPRDHFSPYVGIATDCALRIEGNGVGTSSTLRVENSYGGVVGEFSLSDGEQLVTTEDADPLRRRLNTSTAWPAGGAPAAGRNGILWSDGMKYFPAAWIAASPGAMSWSDGEKLVFEGPSGAVAHYMHVNLPSAVDFSAHHYLTLRLRASRGAMYNLRPQLDETAGWAEHQPPSPLEQRHGQGDAWETLTFNMRSYQQLYSPPASTINRLVLVMGSDPDNPTTAGTPLRLEIDWAAIHSGITPDTLATGETLFSNNLDDDGDGFVDRDDPDLRSVYPVRVLAHYQTDWRNMRKAGMGGLRWPGPGESGYPVTVSPLEFSPLLSGKRGLLGTFYPFDYMTNAHFESPQSYEAWQYSEFADRTTSGIWNPCSSPWTPPTEQFWPLGYDYAGLGAAEEYDVESAGWVQAQAALARRFGLDGFAYNDQGLDEALGGDYPWETMAAVLNAQTAGAWHKRPLTIASFYSPTGQLLTQDVVKSLGYITKRRPAVLSPYTLSANKPAVFFYSNINPYDPSRGVSNVDWREVYDGLVNLPQYDFDGALDAPSAAPSAGNTISFTFEHQETDSMGRTIPGMMDKIEVFDQDMRTVGLLDCGKPEARSSYVEGWGPDIKATSSQGFDYSYMMQPPGSLKPGYASVWMGLASSAAYLKVRMHCYGPESKTGEQQHCDIRVNGDAACRISV